MEVIRMTNKEMWNKVFKKTTIVGLIVVAVLIVCYVLNVNNFGNNTDTKTNVDSVEIVEQESADDCI